MNTQNKHRLTETNKLMFGRGEGYGSTGGKGKGNIVSNNVVTLYHDRQSLDFTESLCCTSETNVNYIVCQLYFNTRFF